MLTWWFCTLGNGRGASRNWENSTWLPDTALHHLKALYAGRLWHWVMAKPCVQNKWVKCVLPLDFFTQLKDMIGMVAIFDSPRLSVEGVFFFLMTVLEPTCNHLMHCTCLREKKKKLLHTAVLEILFQLLLCILFEARAWQLHLWSVSISSNISADISLRPDCLTRTWKPGLKEVITHLGRERQTHAHAHACARTHTC